MALLAFDGQIARQRATPSVFQHIAQFIHGSRFADDTVINQFATRFQHIDNFSRAVQRIALFVGSNQKRDAALVIGMFGNEAFAGGNETGNAGFHIRRAATIQTAFTLGRFKRWRIPFSTGLSARRRYVRQSRTPEPAYRVVTKCFWCRQNEAPLRQNRFFCRRSASSCWQFWSSGVTDGREISALASSRDWVSVIFVHCEKQAV